MRDYSGGTLLNNNNILQSQLLESCTSTDLRYLVTWSMFLYYSVSELVIRFMVTVIISSGKKR